MRLRSVNAEARRHTCVAIRPSSCQICSDFQKLRRSGCFSQSSSGVYFRVKHFTRCVFSEIEVSCPHFCNFRFVVSGENLFSNLSPSSVKVFLYDEEFGLDNSKVSLPI